MEAWPLFHSSPSQLSLCLEPGRAGDVRLCPVPSAGGKDVSGRLCSTVRGAEGRDRYRGWDRAGKCYGGVLGHLRGIWRSASVLRRLKEGNTASCSLLGSQGKGNGMQNYIVKFKSKNLTTLSV